ncbi:hypothetical protein HZS_6174 [Henneguya salminicola]|nr:hypothetical protein HZS_6174 [Henneguya salminicola]
METLPCERTEDVKNVKGIMFESMGLSTELLVGIRAKKFYIPSPIQEEAIPIILKNCDVLARAKNGTGKTATFLIPIIQRIDQKKSNIQSSLLVNMRHYYCSNTRACSSNM